MDPYSYFSEVPNLVVIISSAANTGQLWDKAIPFVGSLAVALVSLFGKELFDKSRAAKATREKLATFIDEVRRLRGQANDAFKDAVVIIDCFKTNSQNNKECPRLIYTSYVAETVNSLAHKLTPAQRHAAYSLLASAELVNTYIKLYYTPQTRPDVIHDHPVYANIIDNAALCSFHCENFEDDVTAFPDNYVVKLAIELEVTSEYVDSLKS